MPGGRHTPRVRAVASVWHVRVQMDKPVRGACLGYLCVSVCVYMCTHVHLVAARAVQKITIV